MKPKTLYITQNSTFESDITVLGSDGEPLDLTGFTSSMFITKYFGSTTKYAINTTIFDAVNGVVRVSISSASTRLLSPGTFQYSIFVSDLTGETNIILSGQAIIIPTVF